MKDGGQERDAAFDRLIRAGLEASAGAADACPEADELAAYYDNTLSATDRRACELHLSACGRCQAQLALVARSETDVPAERSPWGLRQLVPLLASSAAVVLVAWLALDRDRWSPATPVADVRVARDAPSPPENFSTAVSREPVNEAPAASPQQTETQETLTAPQRSRLQSRIGESENAFRAPVPPPAAKAEPAPAPELDRMSAAKRADERVAAASAPAEETSERRADGTTVATTAASPPVAAAPSPPPPPSPGSGIGGGQYADASEQQKIAEESETRRENVAALEDKSALTQRLLLGKETGILRSPDPQIAWRLDGNAISQTTDGGRSWQVQLRTPDAGVGVGAAPSTNVAWAAARGGRLWKTTDGRTWRALKSPTSRDIAGLSATDADHATLRTADGERYITHDGGGTWTREP